MRRKISVIGSDGAGEVTAFLLAERDYADLVIVDGEDAVARDIATAVTPSEGRGRVTGAQGIEAATGSHVVVVARDLDREEVERLGRGAPDAVLVTTDAARAPLLCEVTNFPRARVIGVPADVQGRFTVGAAIRDLADAIVLDRHRLVRCQALCQGEAGIKGFAPVLVRLGSAGVEEIVTRA